MPCGPEVVRALQEKAANALPAEYVEQRDGWWLRYSTSSSWWVATALPHADAGRDELLRRIDSTERFYAEHGKTARFQISPHACPDTLDVLLAERGYHYVGPISVHSAATTQVARRAVTGSSRVRLDATPSSAWFDVWHTVHGHGVHDHGVHDHGGEARGERTMLARVRQPSAYASVMLDNEIVAVGRVVADGDWAGVFSMVTLPRARGQHAGRRVLAAMAQWAAARDADRLYLQVECDNSPALRLYAAMGFSELFRYHYRIAA